MTHVYLTYGLIFDVDGVIADSERVNVRASAKVFSDLFGLDGVRGEDFEEGLGRGAEEYMKAAARVHNLELTAEQVRGAVQARQENFLKILEEEALPPFPGVVDLMAAALRHDDFRVAIATSSTREKSEAVLRSAGISCEKMAYITGSDVRLKKPDPELFLTAATAIDVAPEKCVVIEDAPNGVEAAHAAGSKCVAVTNSVSADALAGADLIIASLADITLEDVISLVR